MGRVRAYTVGVPAKEEEDYGEVYRRIRAMPLRDRLGPGRVKGGRRAGRMTGSKQRLTKAWKERDAS